LSIASKKHTKDNVGDGKEAPKGIPWIFAEIKKYFLKKKKKKKKKEIIPFPNLIDRETDDGLMSHLITHLCSE
jgi:hypothetical protein